MLPADPAQRPTSVRQRLEDQTLADLAAGLGLEPANVQTYDEDGNDPVIPDTGPDAGTPPEAWAVVTFGEEDALHPGDKPGDPFGGDAASAGAETYLLPVTVDLHLLHRPAWYDQQHPARADALRAWKNHWIAAAQTTLMANAYSAETADPLAELALNTRIVGTFGPIVEDEQRGTLVGVEAQKLYRHAEGQPDQPL